MKNTITLAAADSILRRAVALSNELFAADTAKIKSRDCWPMAADIKVEFPADGSTFSVMINRCYSTDNGDPIREVCALLNTIPGAIYWSVARPYEVA